MDKPLKKLEHWINFRGPKQRVERAKLRLIFEALQKEINVLKKDLEDAKRNAHPLQEEGSGGLPEENIPRVESKVPTKGKGVRRSPKK